MGFSGLTLLWALSICKAIDVGMINPKSWSKCDFGSIALYEPPTNVRGWFLLHSWFALPKMARGTLVDLAVSSQI